jgi:hypothetical protein
LYSTIRQPFISPATPDGCNQRSELDSICSFYFPGEIPFYMLEKDGRTDGKSASRIYKREPVGFLFLNDELKSYFFQEEEEM